MTNKRVIPLETSHDPKDKDEELRTKLTAIVDHKLFTVLMGLVTVSDNINYKTNCSFQLISEYLVYKFGPI